MVAKGKDQPIDSDQLIQEWIEPNLYHAGEADVRIRGWGVPVWALVAYLPAVDGDLARVATDYDIPPAAVEAALAYYARHRAVIDARIAANAA